MSDLTPAERAGLDRVAERLPAILAASRSDGAVDATVFLKGIEDRTAGLGEALGALRKAMDAERAFTASTLAEVGKVRKSFDGLAAEVAELKRYANGPLLLKSLQAQFAAEEDPARKREIGEAICAVQAGASASAIVPLSKSMGTQAAPSGPPVAAATVPASEMLRKLQKAFAEEQHPSRKREIGEAVCLVQAGAPAPPKLLASLGL